jgi:hypothetical protein
MALRWAALVLALAAAGQAQANDFAVRTAGAATAIAVDRDSVRKTGRYRTGWTYELYRERNPFIGQRTQITGVLLLADCKTLLFRRLEVVHSLEDGRALSRTGPERAWTEALRGSNTDLILRAMCRGPDRLWARRRAETVFDLYRQVWR